jgi:hypothetical protein
VEADLNQTHDGYRKDGEGKRLFATGGRTFDSENRKASGRDRHHRTMRLAVLGGVETIEDGTEDVEQGRTKNLGPQQGSLEHCQTTTG